MTWPVFVLGLIGVCWVVSKVFCLVDWIERG